MSPGPSPRPPDAAKPIDDFEWPPTTDDLSVYEIGPDPWQKLQEASSQVFAARRGPVPPHPQPAPGARETLAGVIAAAAIVAAAAGWALYASMTRPVAVHAVHHPAPAPAAVAPVAPAPITMVATYPVESDPASTAAARREPAIAADGASAPPAAHPADTPRLPVDQVSGGTGHLAAEPASASHAGGVDTPAVAEPAPAPSEAAAPAAGPFVAAPEAATPDAGIRSLLQRYEEAYDRRDVRTAAALWPSLDQPALTRAFAGLDRQDVHFDRCDIDASGAHGSAVCVGTVRYVPSVGRAVEKEDRITWTFDLARSGEDWRIAGLSAH